VSGGDDVFTPIILVTPLPTTAALLVVIWGSIAVIL
jgi:hypothetical protein